ncbi:MAG: helix-turn-helix transcriptional regulator [Lachnospiraceae bacterium]|nr:helix-turn-helix transcriptional regulator [Lachnospiraceae bacterium]
MDLKLLGLNIKNSRKNIKLTQAQLAEMTNLSTVHISHIEGGSVKMSVDALINICNALNITPNDILWGQFDTNSYTVDGSGKALLSENGEYNINMQLSAKAKAMSQNDKRLLLEIAGLLANRNN